MNRSNRTSNFDTYIIMITVVRPRFDLIRNCSLDSRYLDLVLDIESSLWVTNQLEN